MTKLLRFIKQKIIFCTQKRIQIGDEYCKYIKYTVIYAFAGLLDSHPFLKSHENERWNRQSKCTLGRKVWAAEAHDRF